MRPEILKIKNINEDFCKKIMDYARNIIPKKDSLEKRLNTFKEIDSTIKQHNECWKVYLFGSFAQSISTVKSDIDLAIQCFRYFGQKYTQKEEKICLKIIYQLLKYKKLADDLLLLDKAEVPVVKGIWKNTGIKFVISANRENGPKAPYIIRKIIKEYKILRPTILILKVVLQQKNLNSTKTGGMSSFLLFHLVYFFYIIYLQRI